MHIPALKTGDKIGVMAPSSYVEKKKVLKAKTYLESLGFEVYLHPQHEARFNQSAGTHEEKINALHDLYADKSIKAIIAAGGGNRALHLLDRINYDLIRENPKILMGFSDVTALLNAIHAKTGQITFHGPVLTWIPPLKDHFDFTLDILSGGTPEYPMAQCRTLREGNADGPLIGGNLSLFHYMTGREYAHAPDGAILFLEDLREEIHTIDRMFLHMHRTGYLSKISGLICGGFTDLGDSGRPYGFTLEDLILEHTEGYDIPIVMDAPFGHDDQLYTFPVGGKAGLTAKKDYISLKLIEPSVQTD